MLPRTHGDDCVVLPSLHRHVLNGGSASVQVQIPVEVAFAIRDDSADELADQVGTGFWLGQIQDLFQRFLNPAPLGLVEVRILRILGQLFVFCRQLLKLRIQLLPLGQESRPFLWFLKKWEQCSYWECAASNPSCRWLTAYCIHWHAHIVAYFPLRICGRMVFSCQGTQEKSLKV